MKQTILLTGASSGIGQKIAIKLSEKYNIILSGRNIDKLSKIKSLLHPDCISYLLELDLNNIDTLEGTIKCFLEEKKLVVQKFVHCAGFMKMVPLKLTSIDLLKETFNTNVFSASIIVKLLMNKKYNQSALDNVVFISSNISNRGAKAMSTYGASKSAIDGLMMNFAVELAPKIRVNSVLPGAVMTEMTKEIFENKEVEARMNQQYPLGIGEGEDIAQAVLFLLSEDSRWITGQQLTVDGGRSVNISS
ncbi:SDR family NAD(P)-dependent oxidoreductase [Flavobacterium covae]|uniref:SDR family NAD(P)-dependent oxidoreductase n=1 Tax=Flavobacterium covae TaxID=2906076 RepID=UPI000B5BF5B0|nr:SDR family oxidoreductase [Flavobacterium covae]MCJ1805903.1 SDR family oxidoreductase [Flavobacterium covae]OXA80183.1 short-chain dehydrogenase [Flavobacterium columnare] [Flavobacterium columnare NBRC 100251 = ATCC 23463]